MYIIIGLMDLSNSSSEFDINGLFEIHVSVSEKDIHNFLLFCSKKHYKPIYAISTDMVPQLMLSKFKHSENVDDVIEKARRIAQELVDEHIGVVRIKVEASASNEGVPKVPFLKNSWSPEHYFEWHIKYIANDIDKDYLLLKKCVDEYPTIDEHSRVFVSYNALKCYPCIKPIVTLRVSGHVGSLNAICYKDSLMIYLKYCGYVTHEAIQFEFSVYDNNLSLDDKIESS
jgi:hypothetical protein